MLEKKGFLSISIAYTLIIYSFIYCIDCFICFIHLYAFLVDFNYYLQCICNIDVIS